MITTFSASRPTNGETTQRDSTWNGDVSTLGAPGEESEYGAGDPERVLALVPGSGFGSAQKGFSQEEEMVSTQVNSRPDPQFQRNQRAAPSADLHSSFPR
jgi:hypothetical protein